MSGSTLIRHPHCRPPTVINSRPPAVIISTLAVLQTFLAEITPGTTLYIDLEGANLSRHGTLTLLTAHLQPQNTTYLIDVQTLGHATFITPTRTPQTITKATHLRSHLPIPPTTSARNPQTPQGNNQTPEKWHSSPPSTQGPPTEPLALRQHPQTPQTPHSLPPSTPTPPTGPLSQRTLKAILQDPTIEKCLWDARADADALYWLHGVRLAGVFDVQLLEFLTRPAWRRGKHVRGLAKCVEEDLLGGVSRVGDGNGNGVWKYHGMGRWEVEAACEAEEWLAVKKAVKAGLGQGGAAGAVDVFAARPLAGKTVQYCMGDVVLLPRLRALYMRREVVDTGTMDLVLMESWVRVNEAIREVQCGEKDMALGPTEVHF